MNTFNVFCTIFYGFVLIILLQANSSIFNNLKKNAIKESMDYAQNAKDIQTLASGILAIHKENTYINDIVKESK